VDFTHPTKSLSDSSGTDSKPIRAGELFDVIARLLSSDIEGAKGASGPEAPLGVVFDLDRALATVDDDGELLRQMVEGFLGKCPKLLGQIHDSVLRGTAPPWSGRRTSLRRRWAASAHKEPTRQSCGWRSSGVPGMWQAPNRRILS
jgi:hypothetical protein